MKLRTQLILVFFLLAVVPLSAITIYSYSASVGALRRAVEAESGRTAREMEQRMAAVTAGLSERISSLEEIPFPQGESTGQATGEVADPLLIGRLLRTLGDAASFVEEFEFVHVPPPVDAPAHRDPETAPPPATPRRLVIRMPGVVRDFARHGSLAGLIDGAAALIPPEEVAKLEKAIGGNLGEFGLEMARMITSDIRAGQENDAAGEPENNEPAVISPPVDERVERRTEATGRSEAGSFVLKQEFGCELRRDGEPIGHLKARIDTERLLHQVLSETTLEAGEIPFARDADGHLYTPDPSDLPVLRELASVAIAPDGAPPRGETPDGRWVIATREDLDSGLAFGIAHPVGESLEEIRRTSVQNLAAGMGLAALALFGVLPLSRRMTQNITALTHGARELAAGNLDVQVPVRSRDETGQLAQAFNQMARDLRANQERLVAQERLRRELELCRRIQSDLLPKSPYRERPAEIHGISIPAHELGGDFFNYFTRPDGTIAVLMGDVAGKGVPAALLMANLQATLRARLPMEPDLARFLATLDREIEASTPAEVYLTLFVAVLDPSRNELRYVNAGHESPFLVRRKGGLERLRPTGRPIGLMSGGSYEEWRVSLRPGDRLFLYTDGLLDAENKAGASFGEPRLEGLLAGDRDDEPATLLKRIERAYASHRGRVDAADDATLLILQVGGETVPPGESATPGDGA